MDIKTKRAYDDPSKQDGTRVLVDRLWPRGVSKEDAQIDEWIKELAPSSELRKWFDHDSERFDEFKERYIKELDEQREQLTRLRKIARAGQLTLVYAAHDKEHNNATVLVDVLNQGLPST